MEYFFRPADRFGCGYYTNFSVCEYICKAPGLRLKDIMNTHELSSLLRIILRGASSSQIRTSTSIFAVTCYWCTACALYQAYWYIHPLRDRSVWSFTDSMYEGPEQLTKPKSEKSKILLEGCCSYLHTATVVVPGLERGTRNKVKGVA